MNESDINLIKVLMDQFPEYSCHISVFLLSHCITVMEYPKEDIRADSEPYPSTERHLTFATATPSVATDNKMQIQAVQSSGEFISWHDMIFVASLNRFVQILLFSFSSEKR